MAAKVIDLFVNNATPVKLFARKPVDSSILNYLPLTRLFMKASLLLLLGALIVSSVPALSIDHKPVGEQAVASADTLPKSAKKKGKMATRKSGSSKVSNRVEEMRYRNSATDDGTAINNSNVTNYNSDAVTNAPTGVGSAAAGPSATPKPKKRSN